MSRRRSTKAGCDWADCMCKRCAKDCCLEHENYLCPAGLSEESKQRIARDYGSGELIVCSNKQASEELSAGALLFLVDTGLF